MRRITMLVAVALVTVAMMLATAMPALAVTPYDCAATQAALTRGDELTPLQQELYSTYLSLGACIQDNV
jgi:hypothetical protein